MAVPFDQDQADWNSRRIYADGELDSNFHWDKWVLHYGGGANRAGHHNWRERHGPVTQNQLETETLRIWQDWHIDGRGWRDIAYAYAIGQSGTIFRLRGENALGATRGDYEPDGIPENREGRAVVFILGGSQEPTLEAYAAFARMWKVHPMPVIGHRDVFAHGAGGTDTQCPGEHIANYIDQEGYIVADHQHKIAPEALPRQWADSSWARYLAAGGSTVPESRVWEAYREDLAWFYVKFVEPLERRLAEVDTTPTDIIERLENLEHFESQIRAL